MQRTVAIAGLLAVALSGCSTFNKPKERLVKVVPRCQPQNLEIYFEPDSAEISEEARAIVSQAATVATGCAVDRVDILGLADAVGAPEANLDLSKRRAQSVTAALAAAGLTAGEYHLAAAGQEGAVTPAGDAQPMRRRVNIVLQLHSTP